MSEGDKDKNHIIPLIQLLGGKEGSKLTVGLFEGAEYYNGHTDAPTINPKGYNASAKMTKESGTQFVGYITKFDKDKVSAAFGWDQKERKPLESELYFRGNAIRDFTLEFRALNIKVQYLGSNSEELIAKLLNICLENPAPKLVINTEFDIVRGVYQGFEDGKFQIREVDDMLSADERPTERQLLPGKVGTSYLISIITQK